MKGLTCRDSKSSSERIVSENFIYSDGVKGVSGYIVAKRNGMNTITNKIVSEMQKIVEQARPIRGRSGGYVRNYVILYQYLATKFSLGIGTYYIIVCQ